MKRLVMLSILCTGSVVPALAHAQGPRAGTTAYGARLAEKDLSTGVPRTRIDARVRNRIDSRLALRIERYRTPTRDDPTSAVTRAQGDQQRAVQAYEQVPSVQTD